MINAIDRNSEYNSSDDEEDDDDDDDDDYIDILQGRVPAAVQYAIHYSIWKQMITPHAFKNKALVMVYCEKSFN